MIVAVISVLTLMYYYAPGQLGPNCPLPRPYQIKPRHRCYKKLTSALQVHFVCLFFCQLLPTRLRKFGHKMMHQCRARASCIASVYLSLVTVHGFFFGSSDPARCGTWFRSYSVIINFNGSEYYNLLYWQIMKNLSNTT